MKKIYFTILTIAFGLSAVCQKDNNLTGYPRKNLEKNLHTYIEKNNFRYTTINKSGDTTFLSIRDSTVQHCDFIYHFNNWGKCDEETILTHCSSCLEKLLDSILSDAKYEWIKLNPNLYISKFPKKRAVQIVQDNTSCPYIKVSIIKWGRKEYKKILDSHMLVSG